MPGRTWVIAPDTESLHRRWQRLIDEPDDKRKAALFHPHIRDGLPGDKHIDKPVSEGLAGHPHRPIVVAKDRGPVAPPERYGFRSFDRQWIIPDSRLLNQPNPTIWKHHSRKQIYLTALTRHSPSCGPSITLTGLVPDLHHYKGSFGGRAFPLWLDANGSQPNLPSGLLAKLGDLFGQPVVPEDVIAYLAAVAAHPGYLKRFATDLVQPGLRIPLTADVALFDEALRLGRQVVWLHTFGERLVATSEERPAGPPRLPGATAPRIPADGAIGSTADAMPDSISYDETKWRLWIGSGHVDNVPPAVWAYEVSGKQVLTQWFSYRRRTRSRPIIGDRRPPSPLGDIQPEKWLPEYTAELMNVLHVLGRLVALEPAQADLLDRICAGPLVSAEEVAAAIEAGQAADARDRSKRPVSHRQMRLLD